MFENIVHSIYIILLIVHNTQLQSTQKDRQILHILVFIFSFYKHITWELTTVQFNTLTSLNILSKNWYSTVQHSDRFKHITWELNIQYQHSDRFKHVTWEQTTVQYNRPVQTYYLRIDYSTVQQTDSNIYLKTGYSTVKHSDQFEHITWELSTVQ